MEILISNKLLQHSKSLLSSPICQFNFSSNSVKISPFLQPFNRKWSINPRKPSLSSVSGSNSANYGGWEDLKLIEDSNSSSKLDQFQNFMVSVGIDDRKHVFMFMLGFVSALAISRVRVSSILVFPASVLVFSVGFTLGFVRRGKFGVSMKDMSIFDSKKASKDEIIKFSVDKLRNLLELFSGLGIRVTNLEKETIGGLGLDTVQVGELENYHNVIKTIRYEIFQANDIVETTINDMSTFFSVGDSKGELVDDRQTGKNLNQKSSKRKKEPSTRYFDLFQFIGGLFHENASLTKSDEVKDIAKREMVEPLNSKVMNKQNRNSLSVGRVEEVKVINSETSNKIGNHVKESASPKVSRNEDLRQHVAEVPVDGAGREALVEGMVNRNSTTMVNDIQTISRYEEFSSQNYSSQFMNKKGSLLKRGPQDGKGMYVPHDDFYDSLDLEADIRSGGIHMRSFTMESKTSLQQEESLDTANRNRVRSHRNAKAENGSYEIDFIERREIYGDPPNSVNQQAASDLDGDFASSSSMISEDSMFNNHLTEATDLLKEARECLKGKTDEDRAEVMLHKSARLLSKAAAMKPMSLLAVGQLGNTFLLHGELKLRISRDLRTLLSRNDYFPRGKSRKTLKASDEHKVSRDKLASNLVDVCEECEGLLVEAGRQYRLALSIDGSDVRALYNWGLALSYRAQLIADVGPEAASDADKVYLAAIDKFNAMMTRSKTHAPDALFRWGIALQQRSRLRPRNAKEKMSLLHQAKSLLEDALCMDSNNIQVREALASCISELKHRQF